MLMLSLKSMLKPVLVTVSTLCLTACLVPATVLAHDQATPDVVAQWNVLCGIDHFAADDPIVFPGQAGASHMHSFYGNTTTSANTTTASLLGSRSSCGRDFQDLDHSAYWVPSLMKKAADGSVSVEKNQDQSLVVYYRRKGGNGPQVKPFPKGLRMIAGNAKATTPQDTHILAWDCGEGGPETANIPNCTGGQQIHMSMAFPNCWNGRDLDSADHKSHMAYATDAGVCPADHPVSLPEVTFESDYPGLYNGSQYVLSSGGQYSFHGDFFAAWDQRTQNALVASCLNSPHDCAAVNHNVQFGTLDNGKVVIKLANFDSNDPWAGTVLGTSTAASQPSTTPARSATPSPTVSPRMSPSATGPAELPDTGAADLIGTFIGLSALAYLFYRYRSRRRSLRQAVLRQGPPRR
jgi:hypothetical protein